MSGLNFSGEVVVLPASVTQIGNFDFEALLKFRSFIKDEFGIKCREKLFGCFLLSFLTILFLAWAFLEFLFAFFLPLFYLSAIVFTLVFIQAFVFKLFLNFSDFLLDFLAEFMLNLFLWLRFIELIGSKMVLFAIEM